MMDNTYPNTEFIRRVTNFREELEAFMKTTDDEGNPNPDYTFEDQTKLYETMMNKAYDLALFIESQEAEGYRLAKASADPVQAVMPDVSPAPFYDDGEWLRDVLDNNDQCAYCNDAPAQNDGLCRSCRELEQYLQDEDEKADADPVQAVVITDYPVAFEPVEIEDFEFEDEDDEDTDDYCAICGQPARELDDGICMVCTWGNDDEEDDELPHWWDDELANLYNNAKPKNQ